MQIRKKVAVLTLSILVAGRAPEETRRKVGTISGAAGKFGRIGAWVAAGTQAEGSYTLELFHPRSDGTIHRVRVANVFSRLTMLFRSCVPCVSPFHPA